VAHPSGSTSVSSNGRRSVCPGIMRIVVCMWAKMSLPSKGTELSAIIRKACVKRILFHSQLRDYEKYLVRGFPGPPFTVIWWVEQSLGFERRAEYMASVLRRKSICPPSMFRATQGCGLEMLGWKVGAMWGHLGAMSALLLSH
jgi:hypothetical protein